MGAPRLSRWVLANDHKRPRPRFKIETRYRLEGIRYVISVTGRRLGETRSLADAKQIAQAHWESL